MRPPAAGSVGEAHNGGQATCDEKSRGAFSSCSHQRGANEMRPPGAGGVVLSGRFPTGGRPRCGPRPRGAWSGRPHRPGASKNGVDKRAVFGWAVHPEGAATEPVPQRAWSWRLHARTGEAYVVAVLVSPCIRQPADQRPSPETVPFWKGVRKGVRGKAGGETGMAAQPMIARALARPAPGCSRTGQGPASGRSLRPSGARPHEWTASAGHEAAFCGPQGARTRLLVSHGLGKVITLTGAAGDSWGQRRAVGGRRWPAGRRKAPPVATAEPAPGSSSAATPWGARAAAAARPRTRRIWSIGGNRGRNVTWHRRETCHGLRLRVQALVGGDSILPEE